MSRPWTPDEHTPSGGTRISVKRACNGCGDLLGDVTEAELDRAVAGLPLEDVTDECARCLRDRIADLERRLAAGVTQAIAARGAGASIVMALQGDPAAVGDSGAVVEADPYGRGASE